MTNTIERMKEEINLLCEENTRLKDEIDALQKECDGLKRDISEHEYMYRKMKEIEHEKMLYIAEQKGRLEVLEEFMSRALNYYWS